MKPRDIFLKFNKLKNKAVKPKPKLLNSCVCMLEHIKTILTQDLKKTKTNPDQSLLFDLHLQDDSMQTRSIELDCILST